MGRRRRRCGPLCDVHSARAAARNLSVGRPRVSGMSISALAVQAIPEESGPHVRALLDVLERALADAGRVRWDGLSGPEVLDLVARLGKVGSRVAAVRLAGLAEAEALQAARGSGQCSTGAWLHSTGM